MYQVTVTQQGKAIRTETIKAPTASAAIAVVEVDYPAQTVVLNGQRFSYHGVEFVARKVVN